MTKEILAVILSTILAISLGIALFAGNTKDRLTIKQMLVMAITGAAAGVITWTYLKDGAATKDIVRAILIYTFCATAFTKLIGRVISAFTNISEDKIQKIGLDLARKKLGLDKEENEDKENNNSGTSADGHATDPSDDQP